MMTCLTESSARSRLRRYAIDGCGLSSTKGRSLCARSLTSTMAGVERVGEESRHCRQPNCGGRISKRPRETPQLSSDSCRSRLSCDCARRHRRVLPLCGPLCDQWGVLGRVELGGVNAPQQWRESHAGRSVGSAQRESDALPPHDCPGLWGYYRRQWYCLHVPPGHSLGCWRSSAYFWVAAGIAG